MHCVLVLYHTDSVDPADLDQRTAVKFMSVSCENFYPGRIKSAAFPSKYSVGPVLDPTPVLDPNLNIMSHTCFLRPRFSHTHATAA